jgi:thioredoxin reductase (NADPH)
VRGLVLGSREGGAGQVKITWRDHSPRRNFRDEETRLCLPAYAMVAASGAAVPEAPSAPPLNRPKVFLGLLSFLVMTEVRDVVIIGSGPAGYTAALYTARANLKPLMVEGMQPGGQLTITSDVENFPGYPDGVMGPKMMEDLRRQAERFGTEIKFGMIEEVDFTQRPFRLKGEFEEFLAHSVIISTGASARLLGIDREAELMGSGGGVSACATCDGAFFPDKDLIVIGGGDSAMEESNYLTRFGRTVTLVHRRNEFRSSVIMRERVEKNSKIEMLTPYSPKELLTGDDGKLRAVVLENMETGETMERVAQGMFVAIGHVPNSKIFKGKLDLDEDGYIKIHDGTYTSVEGVFAAGDISDKKYRQAITAAGMGCMAAIDAERWLEAQGD